MPDSSRGATRGGDEAVRVQIGNGETQIVVTPDEIAVLETEGAKLVGLEKSAHLRMLRVPQKRPKVDRLFATVIEPQAKTIIARLFDACDVDDWRVHGSCLVIFSRETDLWSTK